MRFKLTAEGNVIEQLHNRKRSILVSIYQTTKYFIFSFKDSKETNQAVLLDALMEIAGQGYQLAILVNTTIFNYMNLRYFPNLTDFYFNFSFTPVWNITSINYVRYNNYYRFKCRCYD